VALAVLLLDHVTFLFVALLGAMVATSVSVLPTAIVVDVLFSDTPVTGTVAVLMVTAHVAVLLPSCVVAVIVAVPADTPLTSPLADTVALAVLLLAHVTFLFVALLGAMVATSVSVLPTAIVADVLFSDTPVTGTLAVLIVTAHVAVLPPS
jgi:hypothetical protein